VGDDVLIEERRMGFTAKIEVEHRTKPTSTPLSPLSNKCRVSPTFPIVTASYNLREKKLKELVLKIA